MDATNPRLRVKLKRLTDTGLRHAARQIHDQEDPAVMTHGDLVAAGKLKRDTHTPKALSVQGQLVVMEGTAMGKVTQTREPGSIIMLIKEIGSRRNYSDSESSISPRPRERRKSLGEKALAALGLTGATGLAVDKERKERSRRRSRSRSRPRRDRTPSSDSEGYYVRKKDRSRGYPPPVSSSVAGYRDDRTPSRYKPSAYLENGDYGSERGSNSLVARRNNRSEVGNQRNGEKKNNKSSDSSSESSSDVCSSSEDERRTKKMKGKEYITGALAAVATIHAAHSVYNSMEARDKRHKEVEEGKMSAEEARKKKNKARLQDAAAIGIAALGIKGAYSEWQEVLENRQQLAEAQEERKKNHEKRMRKLEKYGYLKPADREKEARGEGQSQRSRSEGGGRRRRDRSYSR